MLVSFVFFGTQLSVAKIFHITEICSKVSFHDDQCILIQNTAVLKVFQNLTLQPMVIWGIHKYAVENALSFLGTKGLHHVHIQQCTTICKFCKCQIFSYACACLGIFFNKNSPSCSAA